jgi:hypothetical protein
LDTSVLGGYFDDEFKEATQELRRQMEQGSDGLDWPTVCKCDLLYTLPKSALIARSRHGDRRAAAANRCDDQSCHGLGLTTKAEIDFSFSAFQRVSFELCSFVV